MMLGRSMLPIVYIFDLSAEEWGVSSWGWGAEVRRQIQLYK
jgi:hypothetical protein